MAKLNPAKLNPKWGYTRIRGALSNLGHTVARSTIANILGEHGIEPAPERGERTPWRTFLTAHWETIAATDFFTIEVATVRRLVTYYVLVVIELSSRKVHIAGITPGPTGAFMMQVGRNLTDPLDGFLRGQAIPHRRPRQEVHHRVPRFARARRNGRHSAAVPFAESERLRRKVCFVSQERVLGPDDLLQCTIAARCRRRVHPSLITESETIKGSGTRCSKRKNASAAPTGRCDVVSDWAACSVITTATPHRRVRACQLDGRDGLGERSAWERLSQRPCRVGWSPRISRTPLGFELEGPFEFSDRTRSSKTL